MRPSRSPVQVAHKCRYGRSTENVVGAMLLSVVDDEARGDVAKDDVSCQTPGLTGSAQSPTKRYGMVGVRVVITSPGVLPSCHGGSAPQYVEPAKQVSDRITSQIVRSPTPIVSLSAGKAPSSRLAPQALPLHIYSHRADASTPHQYGAKTFPLNSTISYQELPAACRPSTGGDGHP